jgi:hypothetical protein
MLLVKRHFKSGLSRFLVFSFYNKVDEEKTDDPNNSELMHNVIDTIYKNSKSL